MELLQICKIGNQGCKVRQCELMQVGPITINDVTSVKQLNNFRIEGQVERDQIREAANAIGWHLSREVGVGEVEMGETGELLKPGGWDFGKTEVVSTQVETPEGGQIEEHRMEMVTLQATITQIQRNDVAASATAVDALPTAAVRAGLPRLKGHDGLIGGGEGKFQPEQCQRLVRQASNRYYGGVVGERTSRREKRAYCHELDL